jgi:predicted RNase H-like HicB family nuclease
LWQSGADWAEARFSARVHHFSVNADALQMWHTSICIGDQRRRWVDGAIERRREPGKTMPRVRRSYPLKLEQDDSNSILVTCPDLPDFVTFGRDEADAVRRAAEALHALAVFRSKRGLRMPQPRRPRRGQAVATILLDVVPPAPLSLD